MNINGINVNYIDYGKKNGKVIVLLHGWGQNIEMMKMIGDKFQNDYRIIILDFPGFGLSEEPKEAMGIDGYTNLLEEMLKKLKVSNPILIGHSFGGRISVKYSSRNAVEKVVLLSPALRSHDKKGLKSKLFKIVKKVPVLNLLEDWAKNHIGSRDYKAASPMMKKVLVMTVNEDLSLDAKKIKAPTILIYGNLDLEVPEEDTLEYEKLIPDCGLILYEGCSHWAYLERINQTINIIKKFID